MRKLGSLLLKLSTTASRSLQKSRLRLPSSSYLSHFRKASNLQQPSSHLHQLRLSSSSSSSSIYHLLFPSYVTLRSFIKSSSSSSSSSSSYSPSYGEEDINKDPFQYEIEKEEAIIDEWEEEDESEPQIGDGGDGGGIVLQKVPWGERVLSIAHEVLLQFGDDMKLFSFKTTPRGYIYVRLDKLSNEYGCPSMDEIENFSQQYKKRLDEEGSKGEIPDDLALEVSSPGAERILRVPEDLHRFSEFPMVVCYAEEDFGTKSREKSGVFLLDSVKAEGRQCVFKLADVRENRDPSSKGRPLSRKQKDLRFKLPYEKLKKVTLYLEF